VLGQDHLTTNPHTETEQQILEIQDLPWRRLEFESASLVILNSNVDDLIILVLKTFEVFQKKIQPLRFILFLTSSIFFNLSKGFNLFARKCTLQISTGTLSTSAAAFVAGSRACLASRTLHSERFRAQGWLRVEGPWL